MTRHSPTVFAAVSVLLVALFRLQVSCVPLSTQLSEEEEKVSKCIMEVLADTLSKASPAPVSSECRRILKEDERIMSMLHHQHLLRELEELNDRENSIHRFGHEGGHGGWEEDEDDSDDNELKKRNQAAGAAQQRGTEKRGPAAASEGNGKEVKTRATERKRDHDDIKEVEKTEKIEEKVKEEKVSHAEDDTKLRMEEAKELLEDEDEDEEDEEEKKKRNAPGKRSRDFFGYDKRKEHSNGEQRVALNEILERLSKEAHHATKKMAESKKHFSDEDSSLQEDYHHDGFLDGHHGGHHREHENWEDDEFEKKRSGTQQRSVNKRVDEKASDEETAQFEAEEKGVKISNMKSHLHDTHGGGHLSEKPWEDKQHFHHHQGESQEDEFMKKRHFEEEPYNKNHHEEQEEERKEEEMEEREEMKKEERELENLEDIEYELKKAAEKLRELHRG